MSNVYEGGIPHMTMANVTDTRTRPALSKRIPLRPFIYICSRYRGNTERNAADALRYCRFAVSRGCVPIAPHIFYAHSGILDDADPAERKLGIQFGIALLNCCNEIWLFGKHFSEGMMREYNSAVSRNIRARFFTEDCVEIDRFK